MTKCNAVVDPGFQCSAGDVDAETGRGTDLSFNQFLLPPKKNSHENEKKNLTGEMGSGGGGGVPPGSTTVIVSNVMRTF